MKRAGRAAGLAPIALVAVAAASLVVLFFLNPKAIPSPMGRPTELLADPSFEQPATTGAWVSSGGSTAFSTTTDVSAHDLRRVGKVLNATVTQDVFLTPVRGRPYRFSVWVRGDGRAPDGTGVAGVIRAQTACASDEEVSESPFIADAAWREVHVTMQPVNGERCTMRVGISVPAGILQVDDATFGDAGLINPSFELGPASGSVESWTVDTDVVTSMKDGGAADGKRAVQLVTSKNASGIRQDVSIDSSSEPVLAVASALVRSVSGTTSVELQYREPCSSTVHHTTADVGTAWQRITVTQPRLAGNTVPPSLINVDGVGCAAQVAIVLPQPGSILVDGTDFTLRSYWPPEGSPSYRKAERARDVATQATTPL